MAKLAAEAVHAAIRQLLDVEVKPEQASALEVFITVSHLVKLGRPIAIKDVDAVVDEVFANLGDDDRRIAPFECQVLPTGTRQPKWRKRKNSGRSTVWDVASRGGATEALRLFESGVYQNNPKRPDIRAGLRPDAAEELGKILGATKLPRIALEVFLLRDKEFPTPPTEADLDQAMVDFGIPIVSLAHFCENKSLGVPLVGATPWVPTTLPSDLRPVPLAAPPTVMTVGVVAVPAPSEPEPAARIMVEDRVRRMVVSAIKSYSAVILVGPPGTGKTALLREVVGDIRRAPEQHGFAAPIAEPLWATPDESWTTRDLVGGETIVSGEIAFRPGRVLQAIEGDCWLVLDETNRADMDRIFGALLTWLSGGEVMLGTASAAANAPRIELAWNSGQPRSQTLGVEGGQLVGVGGRVRYLAGDEWRLLGTYNALDAQRVFRFGNALGRRFVRVPIPALPPPMFLAFLASGATSIPSPHRIAIGKLYEAHFESEATRLGPALFLGMARYLQATSYVAAPGATPTEMGAAPGASQPAEQVIAEAYLVNAGTWVARLEPRDCDALGERIIASGVLPEPEWKWVVTMLAALR